MRIQKKQMSTRATGEGFTDLMSESVCEDEWKFSRHGKEGKAKDA